MRKKDDYAKNDQGNVLRYNFARLNATVLRFEIQLTLY